MTERYIYLFLFYTDRLYLVRHMRGTIGAPGGRMPDHSRAGEMRFLLGRFAADTKTDALPGDPRRYGHFEWGTHAKSIKVFYMNIDQRLANSLPVGAVNSSSGTALAPYDAIETLWMKLPRDSGSDSLRIEPHILQALYVYKHLVISARRHASASPR